MEENRRQEQYTWDLTVFYDGLEDPKFIQDVEAIDRYMEEVETLSGALAEEYSEDKLVEAIQLLERASTVLKPLSFLSLSQSADTNDSRYASYMNQIRMKLSPMNVLNVQLSKGLLELSDFEGFITTNNLDDYRFFLEEAKNEASHNLSEELESILGKLNISGGAAWGRMVSYLSSTLEVEYQDEIITLAEVRNLASDPDREVRKAAYEAELAAYEKIKDPVAFALNSIKLQVNTLLSKRGFESALDQALFHSRMEKETLNSMMEEMRNYFPHFRRYFLAKAKYLGYEERLAWYDLFAPVGKIDKKFTVEEAEDYLVDSFSHISEDIASVIKRSFDEHWIDFMPRKGKVGGAFCSNQANLKQSRILTNFDGSYGSVSTLAHELGHAYHGYCIENHKPLNRSYSMPVAETASTFNETHISLHALEQSDDRDQKLAVLEELLAGASQTIVDISSRFLFEQEVFTRVEKEFLDADALQAIMLKAQEETYGEALAEDLRHPYMWVCKGHYYSTGLSYYNFPYAFGTLFSMGLYAKYREEGSSFMVKYKEMLEKTTVASCEDVAKHVGVDLTGSAFWKSSLDMLVELIDTYEALVNQ